MSPVASAGPPHARTLSTNGAPPSSTVNGTNANGGTFKTAGGQTEGGDNTMAMSRVFRHFDDLVSVRPDVDINSPIRKILSHAELLAKQADSSLEFRRPDVALTEYIKASTIVIDIIPRHKEYPTLQSDRPELYRLYTGLTNRINAQSGKFAEVKESIKENNARSGILPRAQKNLSTPVSDSQSRAAELREPHPSLEPANGQRQNPKETSNGDSGASLILNGNPVRKKPPILPKPNALHGKALHSPSTTNLSSSPADLATRFARLRSPDLTTPQQDPRIHTQPISIPFTSESSFKPATPSQDPQNVRPSTATRPVGPRDMPSVPLTIPQAAKSGRDGQLPGMPRPPDAVYSPSRGTDIAGSFNLPSSSSRSSSHHSNVRKNSAPPISTVGPTPSNVDGKQDYFSPAHKYAQEPVAPMPWKAQVPTLSDSTTIDAVELTSYLALGSQIIRILLVDLRSRDEFDSGHIMSQSIICIEPIGLRRGMSAEDLEERLVVCPDSEYQLYERRADFDLVVFYDQSSLEIRPRTFSTDDDADCLHNFSKALTEYAFEKPLKRPPRLLVGGLDAWIELMGQGSLQTSSTAPVSTTVSSKVRPLKRASGAVIPRKAGSITRQKTYRSRPLSKDEESKWDASLREESAKSPIGEPTSPEEFSYARTTEDFFRRYPELPVIQESMVSQPMVPPKDTYHTDFANSIPQPPTRPAPALPRQRSAGLLERGPSAAYAVPPGYTAQQSSITAPKVVPGLTGLSNPAVLCYMNTAVQAISATEFLREFLRRFTYPPNPPLPRKANERSDPPQLLVRNLGNLMGHLWSGQYDYVTPKTFSRYCNAISVAHKGVRSHDEAFGGLKIQHDATDFLWFLLEVLDDELNDKRNVPVSVPTEKEEKILNTNSYLWGCHNRWQTLLRTENSIITHFMKFLIISVNRCENCGSERRTWDAYPYLTLEIARSGTESIDNALRRQYGRHDDIIEGFKCDSKKCKDTEQRQQRTVYLGHLPDYLIISFNRYAYEGGPNGTQKLHTKVTFPERGIDLTPAAFPESNNSSDEDGENYAHAFKGPYIYDCYAVIQHQGSTANAGHYWTLAKSPDSSGKGRGNLVWNRFNDSRVEPASFEQTQSSLTSVLFLRRRANQRGNM